ncbi:MAG: 30S ribosomal protein S6 [Planctomycetota bacterium]|nr:30S ribosomal protein S6 [Planctomycetota bacterium]
MKRIPMSDNTKRMYEGMFLFPQNTISDLQSATDHVMALLKRADAEVVSFKKWDDRRLAYEIKGNKRGVYFLTFFRCEPSRVADLERSCNLSEQLLRSLVIRADHLNTEDIEAAEGREALADEIKLRSEQDSTTSDSGDGASTVTIGGGSEAPEAPAETATATEEAPAAEETPQEN